VVAVAVAEMVLNVHDSPVEHLMKHDVILLPKLVTVRPTVEQSPSLPSVDTTMHYHSNKVTGLDIEILFAKLVSLSNVL